MTDKIEINKTLTPENAGEIGLVWVRDIIVDNETPDEAMRDILEHIKNGHVIGMSAGSNPENCVYGLYKKLVRTR